MMEPGSDHCPFFSWVICRFHVTLRESNIAMENGPFEDVFPIKHGDIPLLSLPEGNLPGCILDS